MLGRAGRELVSLRLGLRRGLSRGLARWATRTVIVPLPQLLVLQQGQRQEQEAVGQDWAGQAEMGQALAIACNVVLSDVVYFCSKLRHQEYAQVHFSTIKT